MSVKIPEEKRCKGRTISFNPHFLTKLLEDYERKKEIFQSFSTYINSLIRIGLKKEVRKKY